MSIDSKLLEHYPKLNQTQQSIISHLEGPLLVIAGPGSGKTFSLVLRALNLLLLGKAAPEELSFAPSPRRRPLNCGTDLPQRLERQGIRAICQA